MLLRVTRAASWAIDPARGLAALWVTIFALAAIVNWRFAGLFFVLSYLLMLALMLSVLAIIPPPERMTSRSALVARLSGFLKTLWAALLFGAAAAYGALAGVAADQMARTAPTSNVISTMFNGYIWPLLGIVAAIAGWLGGILCAFDLTMSGADVRIARVVRIRSRVAPHATTARWLARVAITATSGWWPWLIAILGPMVTIAVWAAATSGPDGLRLF